MWVNQWVSEWERNRLTKRQTDMKKLEKRRSDWLRVHKWVKESKSKKNFLRLPRSFKNGEVPHHLRASQAVLPQSRNQTLAIQWAGIWDDALSVCQILPKVSPKPSARKLRTVSPQSPEFALIAMTTTTTTKTTMTTTITPFFVYMSISCLVEFFDHFWLFTCFQWMNFMHPIIKVYEYL